MLFCRMLDFCKLKRFVKTKCVPTCEKYDVSTGVIVFAYGNVMFFSCVHGWFKPQVRFWMLDVGCQMLDVRCWMLDFGCQILDDNFYNLEQSAPTIYSESAKSSIQHLASRMYGRGLNRPFSFPFAQHIFLKIVGADCVPPSSPNLFAPHKFNSTSQPTFP